MFHDPNAFVITGHPWLVLLIRAVADAATFFCYCQLYGQLYAVGFIEQRWERL